MAANSRVANSTEGNSSRRTGSRNATILTKIESKELKECKNYSRSTNSGTSTNSPSNTSNSLNENLNGENGRRKKLKLESRSTSGPKSQCEKGVKSKLDDGKSRKKSSTGSGNPNESIERREKTGNKDDSKKTWISPGKSKNGTEKTSAKNGAQEKGFFLRRKNSKELESEESADLKKALEYLVDIAENENETKKQEKIVSNLWAAIKQTTGIIFDNESDSEIIDDDSSKSFFDSKNSIRDKTPFVQQLYEKTIGEISQVWTDAVNLIKSVRNHAIDYAEEKSKTVDRSQLVLEAEMLQLTVDFASNFSKLKTDFMLKAVRKHLKAKRFPKTELENFMDSKVIDSIGYDEDDLVAISKTVKELKESVVRDQEIVGT